MDEAAARERAAILQWLNRFGDQLNRDIRSVPSGPLRTALQGEFSATVAIRNAIASGKHLTGGRR